MDSKSRPIQTADMMERLQIYDSPPSLNADVSWTPHRLAAPLLSGECALFLSALHERFSDERHVLLKNRKERDHALMRGEVYSSHPSRSANEWRVPEAPSDLQRRNVEITGPAEPKMIINALNSGADVFMADFEDSLSPGWDRILSGQQALLQAVRRILQFRQEDGKVYSLGEKLATLTVRPRGWHLIEKNFRIGGEPISAGLFDFGVYFFHNARELIQRGSGPYFYLPKLESALEARLWNHVFEFAQDYLGLPHGTIRATVLIETFPAVFEMDRILEELRPHAAGLNAGRWDYLFSLIKKFHFDARFVLPDRNQITMRTPFMDAYCRLLVSTCHR